MSVDKSSTTTTLPGIGGLPTVPASGSSSNPTSASAEDQLKVSGIGDALGLKWGVVTVAVAVSGLEQLAAEAHGKGPNAKWAGQQLAAIQQDLYAGGFYGRLFKPTLGTLKPQDLTAFKQAATGAASSGQPFSTYLSNTATAATQNGTAGGGTHIIPAQRVEQKVWTPQDIQAAIDGATTATGENLAQKLIGHNATPAQLQAIADQLNSASGAQAQADAAAILAQQETDIASSQAVYGVNATQVSPLGTSDSSTQAFLNAIKQHESTGNYTANSGDGAYGAYQIIPSTWNEYATKAGYSQYANGRADQAPPQVQDAVATVMAQQYYKDQGGSWEKAAREWYDPAYVNDPNYAPPGNNGLTIGQYGTDIVNLMNGGGAAAPAASATNALYSPVGKGLKQGRTDQGVDYSGAGPVYAVGSGTILSVTNSGWPGQGAFIALKLDHPVDPNHSVVYYAEDITPNVKVGERVSGGATLGTATGGGTGIEIGWADPSALGQALAARSGGYTEGVPTQEGQNFLSYVKGSTLTGAGTGGAKGQTTDVYQQPVITPVPATLDPTAAATNYFENQDAPEYQKENLLQVFGFIKNSIGGDSSLNVPVHNTPIAGP